MTEQEELKLTIKKLEEQDFSLTTLRKAIILINKLGHLIEHHNYSNSSEQEKEVITTTEYRQFQNDINTIIKDFFKKLNPNFTEFVLNKMLYSIHRGIIIIPTEITVIAEEVFIKEITLNDFGQAYKESLYLVEDDKENGYKEIESHQFIFNNWENSLWESMFNDNPWEEAFTTEKIVETTKFISNNINQILTTNLSTKENQPKSYVAPISDLNTNNRYYGIRGIYYKSYQTKIYLDHNLNQIWKTIYEQKPTTIKMIVTQGVDQFHYFEILQEFKNNLPVWSAKEINLKPWQLTDALASNKTSPKKHILTKKTNK